MAITQTQNEIIKKYARHDGDTGSAEVQIAVLTADITEINTICKLIERLPFTTWIDEEDWSPS